MIVFMVGQTWLNPDGLKMTIIPSNSSEHIEFITEDGQNGKESIKQMMQWFFNNTIKQELN